MAIQLPYLPSNKNLETLFTKIQSAAVPDKFTHSFLTSKIGLKGTNDRAFIPLLRQLGFIDQSGTPTSAYRLLKSKETAKPALAEAIRKAYAPLFEADENAHASGDKLRGLVAQVAGTDDDMTSRIVSTLNALVRLGDFSTSVSKPDDQDNESENEDGTELDNINGRAGEGRSRRPIRPEFHYNIQIHLPSNATEDVYLGIFNALRKVFE